MKDQIHKKSHGFRIIPAVLLLLSAGVIGIGSGPAWSGRLSAAPSSENRDRFTSSKTDIRFPGIPEDAASAVYAGGCFWGVEYLMEQLPGVYDVASGYSGGTVENPTYHQVISGTTGHLEAVLVRYDPEVISYEELTRFFFEIHDPTQADGQGPDIGPQYLSAIFYGTEEELQTALRLIAILEGEGYAVETSLRAAAEFWPAEEYHQDYYIRKGTLPYCHSYTKRFP